jgi:hypothetical protein
VNDLHRNVSDSTDASGLHYNYCLYKNRPRESSWTHTGRSRNLKLNVKLFHSESAVPQTFIFLTTGAGVLIKTAFLRSYELLPRSQVRNGHK